MKDSQKLKNNKKMNFILGLIFGVVVMLVLKYFDVI